VNYRGELRAVAGEPAMAGKIIASAEQSQTVQAGAFGAKLNATEQFAVKPGAKVGCKSHKPGHFTTKASFPDGKLLG
jgi:hypothetical protein